ncbi:MAG TPA: PQQ-binding-like beta-propeller repeat protein [Gemmatimonadales bacterium]|nr:PQQ-binding-like beta-propeller repeat protein [Gemmatimonadales bacterium]
MPQQFSSVFLLILLAFSCEQTSETPPAGGGGGGGGPPGFDWTRFGWDVGRSSAPTASSRITATNLDSLRLQQVTIDGTVDASAIYLHSVLVNGGTHDVFFVTTTYGKTLAIDANTGAVLWRFTPPNYASWAGSSQVTTATPVADSNRQFVYAAAPDGQIRKMSVADGSVVWSTAITLLPPSEKIASALNYFHGRVIATTGGYIGDAPPYQGHVAILDAATGNLVSVWNSLCSNQSGLIVPSSCPQSGSAIWGRGGAVIDSASGNIFVATGNGLWDGSTNWGDAVLELDSLATQLLANYTPTNTASLEASDADLGSTSPVLLGGGLVVQGGKDALIRLLSSTSINGTAPHQDSEQQVISTPSGILLFSSPAVLRSPTVTWVFAADGGGTAAWQLSGSQLQLAWQNGNAGTSPVVVDGLLFVYDPGSGLRVYQATTGALLKTLPCGSGHWNSPIVTGGLIALPEGNSNSHSTSGVLDIWRLP